MYPAWEFNSIPVQASRIQWMILQATAWGQLERASELVSSLVDETYLSVHACSEFVGFRLRE